MKLAVATICPHVWHQGKWWSFEPYVLEMNAWCELFEKLIVVAPVNQGLPPGLWSAYQYPDSVSVEPYRQADGTGLTQPTTSLVQLPAMILSVWRAARKADAFHVRCPGSIGLVSSLLVPLLCRRRVAKYAGQWNGYVGEPATVRLQRRVLGSRWWGAPVTVYGEWPGQPEHVVPFFTATMTRQMTQRAESVAKTKAIGSPLRVLFVGRLAAEKRVDALIDALSISKSEGLKLDAVIIGEGPEEAALRRKVTEAQLEGRVRFLGALPFAQLLDWYRWADCLVLPSQHSEGWPKVVAEAMCHGVVCIAVRHGQLPRMLTERGILVPTGSPSELAEALRYVAKKPEYFSQLGRTASEWACQFSLDGLRSALESLLKTKWQVESLR